MYGEGTLKEEIVQLQVSKSRTNRLNKNRGKNMMADSIKIQGNTYIFHPEPGNRMLRT